MTNLLTGLIGIGCLVLFLGHYAYRLHAVPLWIFIGSVLAMVIFDFVQSLREKNNRS
jgi:hypothetical protein